MPEALGEELLIIQKEFDGFADTRERLDLLALDKDGRLVVIENKLDDSGRDVVWQALKYVAYCSNLTKAQIRFENVSPSKDHWLGCGTGVSGCNYALIFGKSGARVELNLQSSDSARNKWIFDQLEQETKELADRFGGQLRWRRMDDLKASRIGLSHPCDGYNVENWPEMIDWMCRHFVRLEETFSEPLARLNQQLRSGGNGLGGSGNALGSASAD